MPGGEHIYYLSVNVYKCVKRQRSTINGHKKSRRFDIGPKKCWQI
jgi:hypothetical protein